MKTVTWAVALCLISFAGPAQDAKEEKKAEPPKRISAAQAKDHLEETLVVTGKIAQVSIRPNMVYLNLEKPYPESPFTGVIFADKTNQFTGLEKLKGKQVELNGKITQYRDKPQIVLTSSNQIQVVEPERERKQTAETR